MQAFSRWSPPGGTLGIISHEAEARARALNGCRSELEAMAQSASPGPSLLAALRQPTVSVLAEVKRRSPSKGVIDASLGAAAQARAYLEGGAAAVSILTEPLHFGGSPDDLHEVRSDVNIAVLKKDFHVEPIQLLEARALGASAALLIARALSPSKLPEMMDAGRSLGIELLVEVRDEAELARALDAGATMIGVNNRDLETLIIDPATCDRMIPLIPAACLAIAESGVNSRSDVERYARVGADAVLVGSSLSASDDATASTRALTGVNRRSRGA